MPLRPAIPSNLGWKCPQCTVRSFASSARQLAVGPEHPRYIEIPEPPQQTIPDRPPVKGVLPVPRDVFAGTDSAKSDDEFIADTTRRPRRPRTPTTGSREEWKAKMSEVRRRNLAEGIRSLRARQQTQLRRWEMRSTAKRNEREELLRRPEREDERLTAPSNSLDLDALFNKPIPDPTRKQRIQQKEQNVIKHQAAKRRERMENLHTLYMNARDFIVTPQQLDAAVDKAFGTPERPITFGASVGFGEYGYNSSSDKSVWAEGRPERVQDMLNRATGQKSRSAVDSVGGTAEINKERIRRIAETLTGGKMEKEVRRRDSGQENNRDSSV